MVEWEEKSDPVNRFAILLRKKKILTKDLEDEIAAKIDSDLKKAVQFAEQSEWPKPEDALEDLFINP